MIIDGIASFILVLTFEHAGAASLQALCTFTLQSEKPGKLLLKLYTSKKNSQRP